MWRHYRYTFENKYVSLFCEILYRWTYIHKNVYSYPKDNTFPSSEYVYKIFWFLRIFLFGIFEVIKYTDQNLVLIHLRACIIWLKQKKKGHNTFTNFTCTRHGVVVLLISVNTKRLFENDPSYVINSREKTVLFLIFQCTNVHAS